MIPKSTLAVAVASAAACLPAASSAAARNSARPVLVVKPAVVAPGGTVSIHGTVPGCAAGNTVFLISPVFPGHSFGGEGAIETPLRSGARFRTRFRLPASTRRGRYLISVRCGGGNLGIAAKLRVR